MRDPELHIGQIVRVSDGPFTGFRGEVKAIDEQTGAADIAVSAYGRMASLSLEPHQIDAIPD